MASFVIFLRSVSSTPIVNPPQSGVLGLHMIEDRPVALNGQVIPRAEWADTPLAPGDAIEIVLARQGG